MIVNSNEVFQCEELPRFEILVVLYEQISDLFLSILAIKVRISKGLRGVR